MDLNQYIREGHFKLEIETLHTRPEKWELLYHASGRRDVNLVTEFQKKMLVEWIPTIQSYPERVGSEPKCYVSLNGDAIPSSSKK